ncbi:MAG TPA: TIGR01777 family oxidoreductase [Rhodothermales bacterium]|nr:TIGR01777 family oxidoreductase [Rhodothermales bacterium]
MPQLDFRSALPVPAAEAFRWHERPGALQRLTPPWADEHLVSFEGIRNGQRAVLRLRRSGVRVRWVAEHQGYVADEKFEDVQVKGPFRRWHHVHRFEPSGPDAGVMHDAITFEAPLGGLGEGTLVRELTQRFAYRHRVLRDDLAAHARYDGPPLRVAISGASGLIGTALTHLLTTGGHTVLSLTRSEKAPPEAIRWDPRTGEIEADKLEGVDAVVHLAGEPIAALRWSDDKKAQILSSRERGTELLARTLARLTQRPRVFVSASGVGYYGDRGHEVLTEDAPAGPLGFLPAVCMLWEKATAPAADAGIRTVQMRTGVVLTPAGGALQAMLPAFRAGLGGRIGSGRQYMSWISIDDTLGGYLHALTTEALQGPVNLSGPAPVPMAEFAQTLVSVLNRPAFFPVPAALLTAVTGSMGRELLLASARVVPERLQATGYAFRHADLETALRHVLGRARAGAPFPEV